jgi:hypothetical protein
MHPRIFSQEDRASRQAPPPVNRTVALVQPKAQGAFNVLASLTKFQTAFYLDIY